MAASIVMGFGRHDTKCHLSHTISGEKWFLYYQCTFNVSASSWVAPCRYIWELLTGSVKTLWFVLLGSSYPTLLLTHRHLLSFFLGFLWHQKTERSVTSFSRWSNQHSGLHLRLKRNTLLTILTCSFIRSCLLLKGEVQQFSNSSDTVKRVWRWLFSRDS